MKYKTRNKCRLLEIQRFENNNTYFCSIIGINSTSCATVGWIKINTWPYLVIELIEFLKL
jgi:hypothetical protein